MILVPLNGVASLKCKGLSAEEELSTWRNVCEECCGRLREKLGIRGVLTASMNTSSEEEVEDVF